MQPWLEEIDPTVLDMEALKVRCLGNLELVERVLGKFNKQLDLDLVALERAIQAHDATEAAQVAHRIKGTAGSVSARNLHENASRTEQRALDMQLAELPRDLERMRSDRAKLQKTIELLKQPS
jgi:HPt (histidine-containing phosphotransfer) domain-containing protein